MVDTRLLYAILRMCNHPQIPNLRDDLYGDLYPSGGTMGTLVLGRQGSGKTSGIGDQLVRRARQNPESAIFILDWSGSITNIILETILGLPAEDRDPLLKRLVLDQLGHPEIVIPMPEFHNMYGTTMEEQVQRVARNQQKLSGTLIPNAPVLGGVALQETAPQIYRLLTSITNEHGENWQITEAKRLIMEKGLMTTAVNTFGHIFPETKFYLEQEFNNNVIKSNEKELRSYVLRSMLGVLDPREIRARLGYYRPGWTPREAIRKGLIVLVSGEGMINQEAAQHYLFTQAYSLIMAEINKRSPVNPEDKPALLVLDEVYSLIQIAGMADEIGRISPVYRSRKLELTVIIQALWQLEKNLREKIWSLGNAVVFCTQDFNEALEVAQQLFKYNPMLEKLPAKTKTQNPTAEPDHGQYTQWANWIQSFQRQECIVRRYLHEGKQDNYIRHVRHTRDLPPKPSPTEVAELKDKLLHERGVYIRDALEVIGKRQLTKETGKPPTV